MLVLVTVLMGQSSARQVCLESPLAGVIPELPENPPLFRPRALHACDHVVDCLVVVGAVQAR
jgi:hypothetical protein